MHDPEQDPRKDRLLLKPLPESADYLVKSEFTARNPVAHAEAGLVPIFPISSLRLGDRMSKRELASWSRSTKFGTTRDLEVGSLHPLPTADIGGSPMGHTKLRQTVTVIDLKKDVFSKAPYLELAFEDGVKIWMSADHVRYHEASQQERLDFIRAQFTRNTNFADRCFRKEAFENLELRLLDSPWTPETEPRELHLVYASLPDVIGTGLATKLFASVFERSDTHPLRARYSVLRSALSASRFPHDSLATPHFSYAELGISLSSALQWDIIGALSHTTSIFSGVFMDPALRLSGSSHPAEQLLKKRLPKDQLARFNLALDAKNVTEMRHIILDSFGAHADFERRVTPIVNAPMSTSWGINAPIANALTDLAIKYHCAQQFQPSDELVKLLQTNQAIRGELVRLLGGGASPVQIILHEYGLNVCDSV